MKVDGKTMKSKKLCPVMLDISMMIVAGMCLFSMLAMASGYYLPKEPKVVHEPKDYFGEYSGPEYTFTLDENGFQIKYANEAKWAILNNTLFVEFFDDNGNRLQRKKFGFIEQDGWYEIHTEKHVYKKFRE